MWNALDLSIAATVLVCMVATALLVHLGVRAILRRQDREDARRQRRARGRRLAAGHVPNRIPVWERWVYGGSAVALLVYGTLGVWRGALHLPGRRDGPGVDYQGTAMWMVYLAMLCGAASLLSVVLDHHDTRANESAYRTFARVTQVMAFGWLALAIVVR